MLIYGTVLDNTNESIQTFSPYIVPLVLEPPLVLYVIDDVLLVVVLATAPT